MTTPKSSHKRKPKPLDPRIVLERIYKAPKPTIRTDSNGVIEHNIVTAVIAAAQTVNSFDPATRGVLVQRVRDALRVTEDPAMVQFVLTEIVRDKAEHFVVLRDCTPASFERYRFMLGVPDGAWKYALWAESLPSGRRKTSVDYWIGKWSDRRGEIDPKELETDPIITRCREMLEKLYSTAVLEELAW